MNTLARMTWEEWALIGALLFSILLVALAAWDAGRPRDLPRRPLPYVPRPEHYPRHAEWTAHERTRQDLGHYRALIVPPSEWDKPE